MESVFDVLLVVLAVLVVLALLVAQRRDQEAAERPAVDTAAREDADQRLSALLPKIAVASGPADLLALCDHLPPPSVRLQKSEQAVWVVPDCGYLRTEKEITYRGRSAGVSFRVAKGVTVRTGGSRGYREESENLEQVDFGTVVLTNKHIYFQGEDKERFRVRLDKIVTAEAWANGFLFQRDGIRTRPEAFVSYNLQILAVLLQWLEDPESAADSVTGAEVDEMLDALAAAEADRGDP